MDIFSKFSLPIVFFLLTVAFGFWLSKAGKPYNGALFNIHKLIALSAVVFAVLRILKIMDGLNTPLLIIMLVVAGLCVVALFASGALMSMGKLDYALMLTVHRIAPVMLAIASGTAVYLLNIK